MKIYKIDNAKSKINWSTKIGKLEVGGELDTNNGIFITELGELVEGDISVDLKSLKILKSSLTKEEQEKLDDHLKSASNFRKDDVLVNYKIKEIIPDKKEPTFKGILTFGNLAFGMDMHTHIEQLDDELHAKGNIRASKSNFKL